jgi:uncharacterized protein (TIGR02678 family)
MKALDAAPQTAHDLRRCARQLLMTPLLRAESEPETFQLVRRHHATLDRWFTQRLGYRLHIGADAARLMKTGYIPGDRPLRTRSDRPFTKVEYTLLALTLACTVAGPLIISLRDLARDVRSAAAEADVSLPDDSAQRRALVTVLRWMVDNGLMEEVFENVDAYSDDQEADAVLRLRPDRITSMLSPALSDDGDVVERSDRRNTFRTWMRVRLVEDAVVYRDDLTETEWSELRRRIGEEARFVDEMFGLVLEVRAEGIAAIDPAGTLSDLKFPTTGTQGHAALLLMGELRDRIGDEIPYADVVSEITALIESHPRWSKHLRASPTSLTRHVVDLLCHFRLAVATGGTVVLQPAAARFTVDETKDAEQASMW